MIAAKITLSIIKELGTVQLLPLNGLRIICLAHRGYLKCRKKLETNRHARAVKTKCYLEVTNTMMPLVKCYLNSCIESA